MYLICTQAKWVRFLHRAQKENVLWHIGLKLSRSLKAGHRILAPGVLVRVQPRQQSIELGFLVVTVWTMVSKLQDSSNKRQMDSPRLGALFWKFNHSGLWSCLENSEYLRVWGSTPQASSKSIHSEWYESPKLEMSQVLIKAIHRALYKKS